MATSAGPSDLLLEAGRADLYRRNAFRITQLAVDASPREITRHTEKARLLEKLGGGNRATGALGLDPPPDRDAVRDALQRLRDPERRLVDELFWFWPQQVGQGPADQALQVLGQGDVAAAAGLWLQRERDGSEAHVSMHNLAVLSHATALDLEHRGRQGQLAEGQERERDRCWEQGLKRWRALVQQEGFWSRLTARIRELDDPRLTTGTARRLRAALPLALLRINAHLAVAAAERGEREETERHLGIMRKAGFASEVVEEALRQAVEPLRERIQALCKAAQTEADEVTQAGEVAQRLLTQTQPLLAVIDSVLPAGHPMRDGAHDEVALRALACQIAYGNQTENWQGSKALLEATVPVAASASARGRIQENLTIVSANLERQELIGTCWFCKTQKPDAKSELAVKMYGEVERIPTWEGVKITWKHGTIQVPRCATCASAHSTDTAAGCVGCLGVLAGLGSCFGYMDTMGEGHGLEGSLIGAGVIIATGVLVHYMTRKASPLGSKPQGYFAEFPTVKELTAKGWAVGEKPSNAT